MKILIQLRQSIFLFSALLLLSFNIQGQSADEGAKLFKTNCGSCHAIDQKVVGPALKGVHTKYDEAWLLKWIKNSQELIKSGDAKAVKVFEENNKVVMTAFSNFTDEQVKSIIAFVKSESEKAPVAEVAASASVENTETEPLPSIIIWLLIVVSVLLIAVIITMKKVMSIIGSADELSIFNWNEINATLLIIFLIVGLGAAFWEFFVHGAFTVLAKPAASAHGTIYDSMFTITLALTGIVFVITQILLFWYSYRYKHDPKRKALYYPDNHKLELIWTVIPALVLTVLVVRGLQTWSSITDRKQSESVQVIEVFGQQFSWTVRYAGADNKLGPHDFRQIGVVNALGVDPKSETSKDDIITSELHLKLGQPVVLKFRSRDVIHSAYLPHFRVQMNVVPGLPTQFTFTPTVTTTSMRKTLNDPKFDYVLLCNKICGAAHYRMTTTVVVESAEEYNKWLGEQPKLIPSATTAEQIQPVETKLLTQKN